MSNQEMRKRLASLSFSEKITMLEKLRDRSLAFSIVRVFLVGGPDDFQQKLEPEAQKYLSAHLKGGSPNASRSVLNVLLTDWLLRGHKVRFALEVDGKAKSKEVTSVEALNSLIGQDQTPATLLQGLAALPDAD